MTSSPVFILGASDNPQRYSYLAWQMLKERQAAIGLVSNRIAAIEGQRVFSDIASAAGALGSPDTITMYVAPQISTRLTRELIDSNPRRVIFNPGSENPELQELLLKQGIQVVQACTLVLLRTNHF
jgi:predicted CoA-binding protein